MISTSRLHLRLLGPDRAADAARYLARNREHFSAAGPRVDDAFFTTDYQRNRLARELEMMEEGSLFRLWIYPKDSAAVEGPIGDISLSHIVRGIMHSCFVGYKLDHAQLGRGYMTEALGHVVTFAFDRLGLHRLEANIMPSNIPSQRVVEKLEFVREGYSERYLLIDGRWQDHIRYARINDAWSPSPAAAPEVR